MVVVVGLLARVPAEENKAESQSSSDIDILAIFRHADPFTRSTTFFLAREDEDSSSTLQTIATFCGASINMYHQKHSR